ncbi:MAG: HpcH/HpaI aldolase/citrate lyase family protein [Lachnospiraceae bacterium]|nr:HpcH/HpaI aldolase/citrate lyase family protein [Lachnospiraceae bacterium]
MYNFSAELNKEYLCSHTITPECVAPYTVGALLYCPALNTKIIDMLLHNSAGHPFSLALCLEDSISDSAVNIAEDQIAHTLNGIFQLLASGQLIKSALPQIFIRVRSAVQVVTIFNKIKAYQSLLSGFILPKYSLNCAEEYNKSILEINSMSDKKIYMLPIIESGDVINLSTRQETLTRIKSYIDTMAEYVLNVRIGGNDFCKHFGIRRSLDETIYDILPIANILSDILTVFSMDYVVSGPVWEYFDSPDGEWADGLKKEIKRDKLNGFVGKTVIHPNQIEIVNQCLKVEKADFEDAVSILSFKSDHLLVAKSNDGKRMNEIKTHTKWAEKIVILANIYGVKE